MRRPTILAVDDTPSNLVALEAVLDHDFELIFARSGAEAIAKLQEGAVVDVILMDLQMPVMDGFEAAERIKQLAGCKDIPIVFITAAFREDPHVKRGYQVGGVDYFTKPFDPDLLKMKMSVYASFRLKAAVLKEREDQIRETEEVLKAGRKLTAVLESLPVGILISDTHGRICQTNDEVSRIFKATEVIEHDAYGEMLGWWGATDNEIKRPRGPLERTLASGASSPYERLEVRCFDGSCRPILASASPLFGIRGEIVGAVILIRDVTEPKQIAEELASRVANLISLGVELEQTLAPRP